LAGPPGRPPKEIDVATRNAILRRCAEDGHSGYLSVRALFPDVPANALRDLLRRRRRVLRRRARRDAEKLVWNKVGAVWAADFATPPESIEGLWPKLLLVRDLASGMELAVEPVADETAATATGVLERLFGRHGAPLVLKTDQGSAFRAKGFERFLGDKGVIPLRSPARTPRYNGACESSVRWAKERTAQIAAHAGRGDAWTCEDVEKARAAMNATVADRGRRRGTTAAERWSTRGPIERGAREGLRKSVAKEIAESLERHGAAGIDALDWRSRESLLRTSTCTALERLGYLEVWRRRHSCSDSVG
jgi:transposase InsO family protein